VASTTRQCFFSDTKTSWIQTAEQQQFERKLALAFNGEEAAITPERRTEMVRFGLFRHSKTTNGNIYMEIFRSLLNMRRRKQQS
jgi:hypothetical protein